MPIKTFKAEQWLKKELPNIARANSLRALANANADRRLESLKNKLIEEVRNHPVSQELQEGPYAENSIAIISSADEVGNLFSAIGFDSTAQPVESLVDFLDQFITKIDSPQTKISSNNLTIYYNWGVNVPNNSDFDSEESLGVPEGYQSESWVSIVENGGLIGMNSYLYDSSRDFPTSRSGPAIQAKTRSGSLANIGTRHFVRNPYMSPLLKNFAKRLKSGL